MTAHAAEIGFVERLVWFWSNHLCVSSIVVPFVAGGYEREALRPHVLGRFEDMLNASASHPAMLQYLDNARSVGPKSVAGLIYKVGLNENYARELLELHTLGVCTGYTQDDVISLAKVFTGWTLLPAFTNPEHGVEFVFNPRIHEPGAKLVLGKSYADRGVGQGRDVLADLARHPATAEHVARKLARHFVADDPPAPLVDRLALRFRDTGGDLKEIAKALVAAPEAWDTPPIKLKRPNEWLTAMGRAAAGGIFRPAGRLGRHAGAAARRGRDRRRPGGSDRRSAGAGRGDARAPRRPRHPPRRAPRMRVIVLRGALDGLALAAPVGDPDWTALRGDNALRLDGKTPGLPLDSFFALTPAMPKLHRLYKAGQATIVHAAATPYRERSHFDGQDVLA